MVHSIHTVVYTCRLAKQIIHGISTIRTKCIKTYKHTNQTPKKTKDLFTPKKKDNPYSQAFFLPHLHPNPFPPLVTIFLSNKHSALKPSSFLPSFPPLSRTPPRQSARLYQKQIKQNHTTYSAHRLPPNKSYQTKKGSKYAPLNPQ